MIYDINGNELAANDTLDGYTMEEAPTFEDGKCVYSDSATAAVGSLGTGSSLSASDYVPVYGRNSLFITLPVFSDTKPPAAGLVFYDKNKTALKNYGTNVFWGRGSGDSRVKTAEVFVPANAKYFRTTWWSSTIVSDNPTMPTFTYTFTAGRNEDEAITEELPTNRGMMNAIRRARQLTDIKWTPRVNVPRYSMMNGSSVHFLDWCESGKEYVGIPYSGSGQGASWQEGSIDTNTDAGKWGYYQFWVGIEVSPETFVTAARYSNSIFGERANRSSANYDASIYGDVCTALVSYALGRNSGQIWSIVGFCTSASYGKDYFNSLGALGTGIQLADIRLGDVFQNNTHIAMITDIFRDESGNITAVEISEATTIGNGNNSVLNDELGGMCRRKTWKASELATSYWATNYTMYRWKNFTDIDYTPSKFVDTGREGNCMPIVDLPCIPYLGNNARYKTGYIVNTKICIGATGFTGLTVIKDGETFGTFDVTGLTEVSVGFSAVGSYSAYLTKSGNVQTMACKWTVEGA